MCLAVPGKVVEIVGEGELRMGKVDFSGVKREASLAFVPEVQLGDYVLVHVGFAISRIDEQQAMETLAALQEIGELGELGTPDETPPPSGRRGEELMRHVDEYRDPAAVEAVVRRIHATVTRPWTLMEVCGGQTHSILKFGMDELLPEKVRLVHGPGCPVCVTPLELIDRAIAIASRPDVTFCSFGDMLRVPGSRDDLLKVKARGGDVRIVYSPLDALRLARQHPERQVVFFAVGFETTAPANAMAVHRAKAEGLTNFSVLVAHVLVPPALEALLASDDAQIQGLLAPGHVCAVTGYRDYEPVSSGHRIPIVVTGFEPLDLLRGSSRGGDAAGAGRGEGREPVRRAWWCGRATGPRSG